MDVSIVGTGALNASDARERVRRAGGRPAPGREDDGFRRGRASGPGLHRQAARLRPVEEVPAHPEHPRRPADCNGRTRSAETGRSIPARDTSSRFRTRDGSTGFGQEFTSAIAGDWGGKVMEDIDRVADALAALPYVDRDRMGAMGWSWGGYAVMWLEGHTKRYKALAVDDGRSTTCARSTARRRSSGFRSGTSRERREDPRTTSGSRRRISPPDSPRRASS